jgi:hypothetical protein
LSILVNRTALSTNTFERIRPPFLIHLLERHKEIDELLLLKPSAIAIATLVTAKPS